MGVSVNEITRIKAKMNYFGLINLETHKAIEILKTINIDQLNSEGIEKNKFTKEFDKILAKYNKPKKVHVVLQDWNDSSNDELASVNMYLGKYFMLNFFYNLSDPDLNTSFKSINLKYMFGNNNYRTHEQRLRYDEKKKQELISKYGNDFGKAIFNQELMIGMTKKCWKMNFSNLDSLTFMNTMNSGYGRT